MSVSPGVLAWSDGSTRPKNPGYGGSAYLIIGEVVWVGCAWLGPGVTNNQAELDAILQCVLKIKALKKAAQPVLPAVIHSDSEWAVNSLSGVYRSTKNRDYLDKIIRERDALVELKIQWIKGHAGNPYNEFVDQMARLATMIPGHKCEQQFTREQFSAEAEQFLKNQEALVKVL